MLTDPLTLEDAAAAGQDFTRISTTLGGSDWVEDDADVADTRRMIIRHSNAGASVNGKQAPPIRRHLVSFVHEKWNEESAKTEKAVINFTITHDPSTTFTAGNLNDLCSFAAQMLSLHRAALIQNQT